MTHEDAGHYAAKHPDAKIDKRIAAAIAAKQSDARIACAAAHAIAGQHNCSPHIVGVNIDLLEQRINQCQLGLFGHGSDKGKSIAAASPVAPDLKAAIHAAMDDGRVTCAAAWNVAAQLNLKKIEVACACETLQVKICQCQLGAF